MPTSLIESGQCVCHREPQTHYGMEGYNVTQNYRYEMRMGLKGRYVRVFHEDDTYYETCGPQVFTRFFTVLSSAGSLASMNDGEVELPPAS